MIGPKALLARYFDAPAMLDTHLGRLGKLWIAFAVVVVCVRALPLFPEVPVLHLLVLLAALLLPVVVLETILGHIRPDALLAQPERRLAPIGRWRAVDSIEGRRMDLFGVGGMLSLLVFGLLLNLPVRALEFATAMPFPTTGSPGWHWALYSLMLTDLAALTSCYAALTALAVRRVPLFPRLLLAAWLLDIGVQLLIGGTMSTFFDAPPAVLKSLFALLKGNVEKVGISMMLWLPYLIFSRRVNLTYRLRVPVTK